MKLTVNFLDQILKILNLHLKGSPDESTYEVKNAYEWLLEKIKENENDVQKNKDPFLFPGKLYYFEYQAKYPDKYSYWDRRPVVIGLGKLPTKNGYVSLGINISWYPPKARKYIVERIRELYKVKYETEIKKFGLSANKQGSIDLNLYSLKLALDPFGFSFAIRSYLPEGIKFKYCIAYEHWDKVIRLDNPGKIPKLESKIPLNDIYKEYENYVRYYKKKRAKF